jgi:tetratricopeptide (TPR) repeat protein
MDALQFGQWLSKLRRRHGWRSQRAFVEVAQQEPLLQELHISEDFMGRLEAGLLVHPFKGSVRRRVLALSRLLCGTPRELRAYLRAAELGKLSDEEIEYLERLTRSITEQQAPAPLLLPARPVHLVGRAALLQDLLRACSSIEQGICAVTGMPGVGKSALAYEAVHRLAANKQERIRLFPDGIVALSCTGRRGPAGLLTLLDEIIEIFSPTPKRASGKRKVQPERDDTAPSEAALAGAIDRTRLALAGKQALLLLDDLDPQFPMRLACDALLGQGYREAESGERARLVILATSRHIPPPLLTAYHLHIEPLEPHAACELFEALLGRNLDEEEGEAVQRICAALGYLPLAIEEVVTTAVVEGIPLDLLAVRAEEYPLDRLLDRSGEIRSRLGRALETMNPAPGHRFALLSLLGTQFGLEAATAAQGTALTGQMALPDNAPGNGWQSGQHELIASNGAGSIALPRSILASTAADLGQFVRHSLIELASPRKSGSALILPASQDNMCNDSPRYRLHPLMLAHASDTLRSLDEETRQVAQQNVYAYALDYVQRYGQDTERLDRERHFLAAVVEHAWDERQYGLVMDLVWSLRPILCLGPDFIEKPRRLLRLGAYASQQLHQYYYLSRFVNHLGVLYHCAGDFAQAIRIYQECLDIIETYESTHTHFLWLPLVNLALLDSLLGNHDAALHRADAYLQHALEGSDTAVVACAYFFRGHLALMKGDDDSAYEDLLESERLFASVPDSSLPTTWVLEKLYASADLARVQGDYEKACEYTWKLSQALGGRLHTYIVEAWYDMAIYAYERGRLDDAHAMARRALDMATQISAQHLRKRCLELLAMLTSAFLSAPHRR